MEIKFREKKKYCKDADMYLFDRNYTGEKKLRNRKLIKIFLSFIVICVIASQSRISLLGNKNHIQAGNLSLIFIVLVLALGMGLGFFLLDKIGFNIGEAHGKNLYEKIGGRNFEKYVDADVNIIFNDNEIVWTRASKQLNVGYEEIENIEYTDEYIYIVINPKSVIWIPNEIFTSYDERSSLLNYINLKVQTNNNQFNFS
jgi:hypothetical protein